MVRNDIHDMHTFGNRVLQSLSALIVMGRSGGEYYVSMQCS